MVSGPPNPLRDNGIAESVTESSARRNNLKSPADSAAGAMLPHAEKAGDRALPATAPAPAKARRD